MPVIRDELIAYAKETYGAEPEAPFSTAPTYRVLRHSPGGKWFALFMDVPRFRLGLDGEESVDVVNLKCPPEMSGSLRRRPGILPARHMNREHWITVLLDGTVPPEELRPLLDLSYTLTAAPSRRRSAPASGR